MVHIFLVLWMADNFLTYSGHFKFSIVGRLWGEGEGG
jgi:hypothetical protein